MGDEAGMRVSDEKLREWARRDGSEPFRDVCTELLTARARLRAADELAEAAAKIPRHTCQRCSRGVFDPDPSNWECFVQRALDRYRKAGE